MRNLPKEIKYVAESANAEKAQSSLAELWHEYSTLMRTLRKQGRRQDVVLKMRLATVMADIGLLKRSPP